uniref:MORN repeat-containing protein 5 n=1 Tax=Glossina pallidipes TaxID=7398 RepID=A0A1B0ABG6_GLOPL
MRLYKWKQLDVSTSKNLRFLTGSRYTGTWANSVQTMEGYGIYIFPDGSEYRGYFSRGVFHGKGLLHLAEPYGFTFRGIFEDGHLDKVVDMWFDDELHVEGTFNGWEGDFRKWRYCKEEDRRYFVEHIGGVMPVGPFAYTASRSPARLLRQDMFDVEEGVYHPKRKIITERLKPFLRRRYVTNKEEHNWIMANCRRAYFRNVDLISPRVHNKIVNTNILNQQDFDKEQPKCHYNIHKYHKRAYKGICKDVKQRTEVYKDKSAINLNETEKCQNLESILLSSDSDRTGMPVSTSSCVSFTVNHLVVNQRSTLQATTDMDSVKLNPHLKGSEDNLYKIVICLNKNLTASREILPVFEYGKKDASWRYLKPDGYHSLIVRRLNVYIYPYVLKVKDKIKRFSYDHLNSLRLHNNMLAVNFSADSYEAGGVVQCKHQETQND